MSQLQTRVHIAGEVEDDGRQRCSRCGVVLIDPTGAMSMDGEPMRYWDEGCFVGVGGERLVPGWVWSRKFAYDATGEDEVPCR